MALAFRGDNDRLDHLIGAVGSLHSAPFWRGLLRDVSTAVNRQITAGFWYGRDPEGRSWKPLRFESRQPLMRTKALLRAAQSSPVYALTMVAVSIDLVYARVQQRGAKIRARNAKALRFRGPGGRFVFAKTVTIPARPFLPTGDTLPQRWRDPIAAVIEARLARTLRA